MFGLSSLTTQLLGAVAIAAIAFGGGFYTESRFAAAREETAALAQQQAIAQELRRQTSIALKEGAAGQYLASEASQRLAAALQKQSAATQAQMAAIPRLIPTSPSANLNPARGPAREEQIAGGNLPAREAAGANPGATDANTDNSDIVYRFPWGFVRVLDAAAIGAADPSAISVGAGESDTAASDVTLSEIAALSAANDGACRANAEQLAALEQWTGEVERWYAELVNNIEARN